MPKHTYQVEETSWFKRLIVNEDLPKSAIPFPWFTFCISIIDIALFIHVMVDNKGFVPMSQNPLGGPSTTTLIRNGAKFVPCMKPTKTDALNYTVDCPPNLSSSNETCTYEEYLQYMCNVKRLHGFPYQGSRFFIAVFFHVGIIHLLMNLISQLLVGTASELRYGSVRTAFIYFLSGIGSFLLSAVALPNHAAAGASGAIFGIYGTILLDTIFSWSDSPRSRRQIISAVGVFIVSLVLGFVIPMIDYMAHLGGALVGILSGLLVCPNFYWRKSKYDPLKLRLIIMVLSFVLLFIFFLGGFVGFFQTPAPVLYEKT